MLNYDILELLFNYLDYINHIFNFRLIDKDTNEIYMNFFKKIKIDIMPRSTYINFKECYICYKKCQSVKQLIYKYDSLPHKCLIHCNNKLCYLSVIKRYLNDVKNNHIYPFCYINTEDEQNFRINNKIISNFYLDTLKKYNGKWYIKISDNIFIKQKYIRIRHINNLNNLNLFAWYLTRKNKSLN